MSIPDPDRARQCYERAVKQAYRRIDFTMPQRVGKALLTGKHVEKYGVESAIAIVKRNCELRSYDKHPSPETKEIIGPRFTKQATYQRANVTVVNAQAKVRNAVNTFHSEANRLHETRKLAESVPTSRAHRRAIRAAKHNLSVGNV